MAPLRLSKTAIIAANTMPPTRYRSARLLASASLAAQTDKRSLTSAVGQVQLSAVMLPTAHLDGSSRIAGWRRSDSGAEGVATLAVLPNSAYRLVVYRIDQEGPAAAEASRRIWVASSHPA